MLEYLDGNTTAIIVLHEIYGVNDFIIKCCRQYHLEGYDVFCPNLFRNNMAFPYENSKEAYQAYRNSVGFDAYKKINALALELKQSYAKVFIIGFSVGATLAWRCSESPLYDGVICCYGSRIRDCTAVVPQCPALLVFARQDSFDVAKTVGQLRGKKHTTIEIIDGAHGFADCYCTSYSQPAAELLDRLRINFLAARK